MESVQLRLERLIDTLHPSCPPPKRARLVSLLLRYAASDAIAQYRTFDSSAQAVCEKSSQIGDQVSEVVTLVGRLKGKRLPRKKKEVLELLLGLSRERGDCFFQEDDGRAGFGAQVARSPSVEHGSGQRFFKLFFDLEVLFILSVFFYLLFGDFDIN